MKTEMQRRLPLLAAVTLVTAALAFPDAYPYWRLAGLVCLGALVLYAALPWPTPPRNGLAFTPPFAAFVADLIILLLHGLISFVLFHVAAQGTTGLQDWSLMLAILAGELLIFGLFLLLPAWFVTIQLEVDENTLIYRAHGQTTRFPFADITTIAAVGTGRFPNLQIITRGGATVLGGGLPAFTRVAPLVRQLRQRGIHIDASFYRKYTCAPDDPAFAAAFPPAPGSAGVRKAVTVIALILLAAMILLQ